MWNLLEWLYPSMTVEDCELMDEGNGIYITYWNTEKLGPGPTPEYLDLRVTEFTLESLRSQRITEVKEYSIEMSKQATGNMDQLTKDKALFRHIKLIRKENKGNITAEETEELDQRDSLSDYSDDIDSVCDTEELYLESEDRTSQELQEYSAESSPDWPSPPEI